MSTGSLLTERARFRGLRRRLASLLGAVVMLFAFVVLLTGGTPPPPGEPVPRDPPKLAERLTTTTRDLHEAIDRWRATTRATPPQDVTLDALYQQRMYIALAANARLSRAVLGKLPAALDRQARDEIEARRTLARLSRPRPLSTFRVGPAEPAARLRRYYVEAERRFGVSWRVLAAVNYLESAYNKLRNASSAGAQGPMQFLPATWRVYGLGGDIHDPHDAIIGAANYLHASGAPRDYRRALYHYNPSSSYVDAVLRYARLIRADTRAYYVFYSRQVF